MIYGRLIEEIDSNKVLENVPLKEHISFKVGGPCRCMVFPSCREDIEKAVRICKSESIPYYILGNGSNVIAGDEGYRGVIIKIGPSLSGITVKDNIITAQAGATLASVSKKALENSLTGIEFAGGIPGTVGGGVIMNAGAYGGELKDVVAGVVSMDETGGIHRYSGDDCEFGYRTSIFQKKNEIVLEVEFKLLPGDYDEISAEMHELMRKRNEKQPLNYPSAGSTFKRPEGHFAGKLIQDSGLKGLSHGGAQVSELHAGFIINRNNATAKDILELIELVKNTVYDNYGVELQPEVRLIK